VKATSLGHQDTLRPGLSTKLPTFLFNVSIDRPEDWKGACLSRKMTAVNWVSSLLVNILTRNDFTYESRHPCLVTFPLPSMVRTAKSDLVGLDHLTNSEKRKKKKTLGSCPLSNSRQPL
jgi:hypothetical protein